MEASGREQPSKKIGCSYTAREWKHNSYATYLSERESDNGTTTKTCLSIFSWYKSVVPAYWCISICKEAFNEIDALKGRKALSEDFS